LLNFQDGEPTADDRVKIRNQSALEEAEEPESEVRERIVKVSTLTAWLGLPKAGIKVLEDIALPPVLSDIGDDDPDAYGSRGSVCFLNCHLFVRYRFFNKRFLSINTSFSWSK
jgi:hypothetical protein